MRFYADLHIHSHFSIATSKQLIPEYLDAWARIKGITVVGTGDFTHPGWLSELKEKLVPAEPGLFQLEKSFSPPEFLAHPGLEDATVRFLLTAEISNIYKRGGKTRKVHNLIWAPSFEAAERLQSRLEEIGNIRSDGRPILGLDSRDLLEICLDTDPEILLIPAHIWTPWFSALGSKSGFDTIDEAYADLASHICAVETGLSADPPMHWMASHLDRFAILSNSDAHSPEKLGREANLLNTELSYAGIVGAYRANDPEKLLGTIEFYPQEGKYHYDGHRKCGVAWDPAETLRHGGVCSVCGKPVTVGVMHRAVALSDRASIQEAAHQRPFWSAIPLVEMLSEIEGVGPASKRVKRLYHGLIDRLGPELPILIDLPLERIAEKGGEVLAEAVGRVRDRRVHIEEGYDGEYGRITVFAPGESKGGRRQPALFETAAEAPAVAPRPPLPFDMAEVRRLMAQTVPGVEEGDEVSAPDVKANDAQEAAIAHTGGPAMVLAGPGTGKTRVLTQRIARLIGEGQDHSSILALTFTNKAAQEMAQRLETLLGPSAGLPLVSTFHGLGYRLLTEFEASGDLVHLLDRPGQERFLSQLLDCSLREASAWAGRISLAKRRLQSPGSVEADLDPVFDRYEAEKRQRALWDLDDLVYRLVRLLELDLEALTSVVQRWPVILIDEYQDLDEAQYRLVRLLAPSGHSDLMVIGDPDQAIYGFRGADARFMARFRQDYAQAKVYALSRSYRCSDTILAASGRVLGKSGPEALEGLHAGVKIRIAQQPTDKAEAEFVARTIESLIGGLRFFSMDSSITTGGSAEIDSLAQVAVLCRTRRQFPAIQKAFHDHAIPYQAVGETPFTQREPLHGLIQAAQWMWLESHPHLEAVIAQEHPGLVVRREALVHALAGMPVSKALTALAGELGLKNHEDLERLIRLAAPYGHDKRAFFRDITLGQGVDAWEDKIEQVSLMTLHAAKGLEFDAVFLVGCEAGLLPFTWHGREADVEEERRLLYVGMTRARRLLFLSHARRRMLMGQSRDMVRSPFLDPIEEALLERLESAPPSKKKPEADQLGLF